MDKDRQLFAVNKINVNVEVKVESLGLNDLASIAIAIIGLAVQDETFMQILLTAITTLINDENFKDKINEAVTKEFDWNSYLKSLPKNGDVS